MSFIPPTPQYSTKATAGAIKRPSVDLKRTDSDLKRSNTDLAREATNPSDLEQDSGPGEGHRLT